MTWTQIARATSNMAQKIRNKARSFLLKEDGGYLLLENGGRILLVRRGFEGKARSTGNWTIKPRN